MNFTRVLASPLVLAIPSYLDETGWRGFAIGFVVWFLLCDMNFLLHQHVHLVFTKSTWVNRLIDIVLGVVTGMPAGSWRIHHVYRHHAANDSWSKIFDWESRKFSILAYITYSIRYGLAMLILPIFESLAKAILFRQRKHLELLTEQTLVLGAASLLIYSRPGFFLPYYFFVYFFTAATDYENHVGCDDSPFGFSNNTVNPIYNWVRNNFGYHTAHHYYPNAHWTELPLLHTAIKDRIPNERITSNCWTGFMTPPLFVYLALWALSRFSSRP